MAFYCYKDRDGVVHDVQFPMGEAPEECTLPTGERGVRDRAAELPTVGVPGKGWPIKSYSCGVHPDDRVTAMEDAAAHGVPTYYDERGLPEWVNARHARRFRKYLKAHDRDGFFD